MDSRRDVQTPNSWCIDWCYSSKVNNSIFFFRERAKHVISLRGKQQPVQSILNRQRLLREWQYTTKLVADGQTRPKKEKKHGRGEHTQPWKPNGYHTPKPAEEIQRRQQCLEFQMVTRAVSANLEALCETMNWALVPSLRPASAQWSTEGGSVDVMTRVVPGERWWWKWKRLHCGMRIRSKDKSSNIFPLLWHLSYSLLHIGPKISRTKPTI